jgi:hypothetical protein
LNLIIKLQRFEGQIFFPFLTPEDEGRSSPRNVVIDDDDDDDDNNNNNNNNNNWHQEEIQKNG